MYVSDYVLNGRGVGEVGEHLASTRFDPGLSRPYLDSKGRACVTVNSGRRDSNGNPVLVKRLVSDMINNGITINGPTSLRKEEWVQLDQVVLRAYRNRLRAWSDLAGANSFGGFDAMSKLVLEYETMSDPGEAFVDMDGMSEGRSDAPRFQLQGIPLPITHSGFWFSARKLAVSRNSNTPLDSVMAEVAGRRIAETVERTTIGLTTGMDLGADPLGRYQGNDKVYGYMNYPYRITKTDLTTPNGTNAANTVADVIAMRELAYDNFQYGPFILYHSTDWDKYFDMDYILTGGNVATQTLRERLEGIDGISAVRRLDLMTSSVAPFTMLLVQMQPDTARAINGMAPTTVQWQSMGGMRLNFKVMAIQVPQIRSDINGKCGIVHATTS